ncbi:hypothetical protein J2T15_003713 [Paenibacillus harenae]|uniref:Uncharacterized protein n=1 Tax=Paenibacillus harenae TaxID=306543 RepID=A0ABT9U3X3_PAEHA|nr:hypothetical protein [Paenibacillus harenae]
MESLGEMNPFRFRPRGRNAGEKPIKGADRAHAASAEEHGITAALCFIEVTSLKI